MHENVLKTSAKMAITAFLASKFGLQILQLIQYIKVLKYQPVKIN